MVLINYSIFGTNPVILRQICALSALAPFSCDNSLPSEVSSQKIKVRGSLYEMRFPLSPSMGDVM